MADEQCWDGSRMIHQSVTSSAGSDPLQMMRCDVVSSQTGVKTDSIDRLATTCDTVGG
jgi:hypothetical protein